jgi:hypothetical protein
LIHETDGVNGKGWNSRSEEMKEKGKGLIPGDIS